MSKVDDKREAILQATLRLVSEYGFHGTAMSKVAREAGVSAGIIYHYFKNKDALLTELYLELKQQLSDAQLSALDSAKPLSDQIRQIWNAMIRWFIAHPCETAYVQQFSSSPYFTAEVEEQSAHIWKPLRDVHTKALEASVIKDLPMPVFGTLAVDVPSALVRRQAAGQLELTEEVVESVVESLWQAIKA